jgi:hypothetical protein
MISFFQSITSIGYNFVTNISSSLIAQAGYDIPISEIPTNLTLLDTNRELFLLEISDFSYILPELFLISSVLFIFTYGIFMKKSKYNYQITSEFVFFSLLILFFDADFANSTASST